MHPILSGNESSGWRGWTGTPVVDLAYPVDCTKYVVDLAYPVDCTKYLVDSIYPFCGTKYVVDLLAKIILFKENGLITRGKILALCTE